MKTKKHHSLKWRYHGHSGNNIDVRDEDKGDRRKACKEETSRRVEWRGRAVEVGDAST